MDSAVQGVSSVTSEIKKKLIFRNEDELDTGMQKVQPLPFLDEEIKKHVKMIEDSIPAAKQVNDDVPEQVYESVQAVIHVATNGETTLFKASDLLEQTSEAFEYARRASINNFMLEEESVRKLREYDEAFKRMIHNRIETNIDQAGEEMKECRKLLGLAVDYAERDRENVHKRTAAEHKELSEPMLDEMCSNTHDSIRDEEGELEMIQSQCIQDISTIDLELDGFDGKMNKIASSQKILKEERETKLQNNRTRQEALKAELDRLWAEEQQLVESLETGKQDQEEMVRTQQEVHRETAEWKLKIKKLQNRTQVALDVMKKMEGCTNVILNNAKEKKREWWEKLDKMEKQSLLNYRDSLIAQGVLYMVIINESKENSKYAVAELRKLTDEKRKAAQTGFAIRVKELEQSMQRYKDQIEEFQRDVDEMTELLAGVKEKVTTTDTQIKRVWPSIKLDTLDDCYKLRKKCMAQAFDKNSVDSVEFISIGRYYNI